MERRQDATRSTFVSLVLAIALLIVGCGGSSKDPPKSTSSSQASTPAATGPATIAATGPVLSKAKLIKQADADCKIIDAGLRNAKLKSETVAELVRVTTAHAVIEQGGVEALSKLRPPTELKKDWQLILTSRQKLAEELVGFAHDVETKNRAGMEALGHTKGVRREELLATATRDGFKICGQVGT